MNNFSRLPIVIAGGNGYVSGELLRLLALHPRFSLECVTSSSHAGEKILTHFPHLTGCISEASTFVPMTEMKAVFSKYQGGSVGLFLATPHGSTAGLAAELAALAEDCGTELKMVDLSADFRFNDTDRYSKIYKQPHGAPKLQSQFSCACPDLSRGKPATPHVAHPGCFTTATTLGAYPFFEAGLVEPELFVSAVTGSSGSGRKPVAGTHHPERNNNMLAYSPLAHRHESEMRMLIGRASVPESKGGSLTQENVDEPEVAFVPHSGAFSRGIHATLQMRLKNEMTVEALVEKANAFYAHTPFVQVFPQPPRLIDVAGTNRCHLGIAVRGRTLVVLSVIDNMIKGSAGGGVQWMNRLFGLPAETGLKLPGLGWY